MITSVSHKLQQLQSSYLVDIYIHVIAAAASHNCGAMTYMSWLIDFGVCHCFYSPDFEEVEGAYWFDHVSLSICLSVSLSIMLSCGHDILEPFKI